MANCCKTNTCVEPVGINDVPSYIAICIKASKNQKVFSL